MKQKFKTGVQAGYMNLVVPRRYIIHNLYIKHNPGQDHIESDCKQKREDVHRLIPGVLQCLEDVEMRRIQQGVLRKRHQKDRRKPRKVWFPRIQVKMVCQEAGCDRLCPLLLKDQVSRIMRMGYGMQIHECCLVANYMVALVSLLLYFFSSGIHPKNYYQLGQKKPSIQPLNPIYKTSDNVFPSLCLSTQQWQLAHNIKMSFPFPERP